MSRLTFGYHLPFNHDILGIDFRNLQEFLRKTRDETEAALYAGLTTHMDHPAARIRLEGSIEPLEKVLMRIVAEKGLPEYIVKPISVYNFKILPDTTIARWKEHPDSPTTRDAYLLAKDMYRERNIRVASLSDKTLALAGQYL